MRYLSYPGELEYNSEEEDPQHEFIPPWGITDDELNPEPEDDEDDIL